MKVSYNSDMAENVFEAVVVHTGLPASIECELIVVPVFEGETTETVFFPNLMLLLAERSVRRYFGANFTRMERTVLSLR